MNPFVGANTKNASSKQRKKCLGFDHFMSFALFQSKFIAIVLPKQNTHFYLVINFHEYNRKFQKEYQSISQ
jgi:hypothetical protein